MKQSYAYATPYVKEGHKTTILVSVMYLNYWRKITVTYSLTHSAATDRREQMNMLTSYIDGNTVYGGSVEENDQLRTKSGGM